MAADVRSEVAAGGAGRAGRAGTRDRQPRVPRSGARDGARRARSRGRRRRSAATVSVMHVCGSHEQAIAKFGLRASLPDDLNVIMGPGCPVCITDQPEIDEAVALAQDGVRIATYGDMVRVPGTAGSLADAQARRRAHRRRLQRRAGGGDRARHGRSGRVLRAPASKRRRSRPPPSCWPACRRICRCCRRTSTSRR